MSGEDSKRSGEIGEKLADNFFEAIGWKSKLQSVSVACSEKKHRTTSDNQKGSHGNDRVFIYNSPFFDNRTDVVHISVKNNLDGYSESEATLKRFFKDHLEEANEIIECAQYDKGLTDLLSNFGKRKHTEHSGVLVWTSSHTESHNKDILSLIKNIKTIGENCRKNVYFIDGARIDFLLSVVRHASIETDKKFDFFYPESGGTIGNKDERYGPILPLELIVADLIPIKATIGDSEILLVYVNQAFDTDTYRRLLSLALAFAGAWPKEIRIGFPDFNLAHHGNDAVSAEFAFSNRKKKFVPFCFVPSNLAALEKK